MRMFFSIFFFLFSYSVFAQSQKIHDATILRVIDGDTIVIAAPYLPEPLKKELAVRIYGVDTPEKGSLSKCQSEKDLAKKASDFVRKKVKESKDSRVNFIGWDKYGGRVLGDILLDNDSLRMLLLQNGFAREYFGGRKKSWCN